MIFWMVVGGTGSVPVGFTGSLILGELTNAYLFDSFRVPAERCPRLTCYLGRSICDYANSSAPASAHLILVTKLPRYLGP